MWAIDLTPMIATVLAFLASRRAIVVATLLAVVLTLPSLGVGWLLDDYFHLTIATRPDLLAGAQHSPVDLFRFMDGDPARTQRLMDRGLVPWWTWPGIRGAFWRPVTSGTHWLDYRLWPDRPALMHAHSIAWYGLLALAVGLLYRGIMTCSASANEPSPRSGASPGRCVPWAAGLAAILYAVDDAHGMPVGWLANRNAVVAACFGVVAMIAHHHWRRDPSKPAGWAAILAAVALGLSVLAAEAGIATCAYLFAYAVFLDAGSVWRRLATLAPYALVIAGWRTAWVLQGYGVEGLGLYADPLHQPLAYLAGLARSAPLLMLGQWVGIPAEMSVVLSPRGGRLVWMAAVLATAGLAVLLAPVVRRSAVGRFWACGMLLSLLPVAATFPSDRLLFFVGIGAMGLLALFVQSTLETPVARWRAVAAGALVVVHLLVSPVALAVRSGMPAGSRRIVEALHVGTPLDERIAGQDLIVVNAPSVMHAHYLAIMRPLQGEPAPRRTRVLAPAVPGVTVHRPDEHSLHVHAGYLSFIFDTLFRSPDHPFDMGERIELAGMTARIESVTVDGRPAEVSFAFDVPLEDPSLRWLCYRGGQFVPFEPPAVGQTVTLQADWPW